MATWRKVLGIGEEDVDFEAVHMRYRELLVTLSPPIEIQQIDELNEAFEAARKELATAGRRAFRP